MENIQNNSVKNCFLEFRNKKVNTFIGADTIIGKFAGFGYYFDKVAYISYSDSGEIKRVLNDGKENFSNVIVYCPKEMENTLKRYLSKLYGTQFSESGNLKTDTANVFILLSDRVNRLQLKDIKDVLDKKYNVKYDKTYVKTAGAPQSKINAAVRNAKNICPEVDFNITESYGVCSIEIVYSSNTAKMVLDEVIRSIVETLNDYIYAMEDVSPAERLYQVLKLRRLKISIAESFTGGGVGKSLVEVPGASSVYYEGLNTYSNAAKTARLGVKELTLKQYGAVSPQTAYEMAEGLLDSGKCGVSIATTGIAGPKSDNSLKPVGLVYIAVGVKDTISVYKYNLKGDRENITNTAINLALFLAYKTLK